MSVLLLTIDEVAERLRCSARSVKRKGITYIRSGNRRLYRPADVDAWMEKHECHSSDVRPRRTGTPRSRSAALGWSDLQARQTGGKRSGSKVNCSTTELPALAGRGYGVLAWKSTRNRWTNQARTYHDSVPLSPSRESHQAPQ
jgi:excisionase family DNA binding protein